eukprot:CAMPEP_0118958120 /NCGR_PEP_ID=MMETSP1169-20130426/62457_1 /TAXON_ID=36882 /ORGANISM="Pyramimonas obovata, Strain CCMP722" /LENGTH=311 /DNA_ID=CAMNT_0006906227 /DNA_START=806 /DNA_END=1737 /DNA_ORIENTATION=+
MKAIATTGGDDTSPGLTSHGGTLDVGSLLGRKIRKLFGKEWYGGVLDECNEEESLYHVSYSDGDEEVMTVNDAVRHLVEEQGFLLSQKFSRSNQRIKRLPASWRIPEWCSPSSAGSQLDKTGDPATPSTASQESATPHQQECEGEALEARRGADVTTEGNVIVATDVSVKAALGIGVDCPVSPSPSRRYRGVTYHKPSGKWVVRIWLPGSKDLFYVGSFAEELAAASEYDRFARRHLVPASKLNFPIGIPDGRPDSRRAGPPGGPAGEAVMGGNPSPRSPLRLFPEHASEGADPCCEKRAVKATTTTTTTT